MIIKKAGLIKGGRPENADNTRTGSWPLRRGASYGVGSSSGGGRRPTVKPGERVETLDEVARWGLSDPPQQYGLRYPHF